MDKIKMTCTEIEEREGFVVVHLNYESIDPTIAAGGNVSFTHFDGSLFEVGKCYGLNLEPIE